MNNEDIVKSIEGLSSKVADMTEKMDLLLNSMGVVIEIDQQPVTAAHCCH